MAITASAPSTIIFERTKLVLTHPATCWPTIASESRSPREVFTLISLPLILLGTICAYTGAQLFGPVGAALSTSALVKQTAMSFVLACGAPFLSAFVLTRLAPFFQSSVTFERAFSWSAHSSIPSLVAGLFSLFPLLGAILSPLLGLLSLYAAYAGLPTMATVPQNQRVALFVTFIVTMIIAGLLLGALLVATRL